MSLNGFLHFDTLAFFDFVTSLMQLVVALYRRSWLTIEPPFSKHTTPPDALRTDPPTTMAASADCGLKRIMARIGATRFSKRDSLHVLSYSELSLTRESVQ